MDREERKKETAEIFTPDSLIEEMTRMIPDDVWMNPSKTFLDNSCGNGNILLYIIKKKLDNGSSYIEALNTVYGIDLMKDNIEECYLRIKNILKERNINYDEYEVDSILKHNIVCYNALDWDYDNWCPNSENAKKPLF